MGPGLEYFSLARAGRINAKATRKARTVLRIGGTIAEGYGFVMDRFGAFRNGIIRVDPGECAAEKFLRASLQHHGFAGHLRSRRARRHRARAGTTSSGVLHSCDEPAGRIARLAHA